MHSTVRHTCIFILYACWLCWLRGGGGHPPPPFSDASARLPASLPDVPLSGVNRRWDLTALRRPCLWRAALLISISAHIPPPVSARACPHPLALPRIRDLLLGLLLGGYRA